MERKKGIHFYINIANLDDVVEREELQTGNVKHVIHALDTFFTSIEDYGKKHYSNVLVIEKITGSRLHIYIVIDNIMEAFEIVSAVSYYAYLLTIYFKDKVNKYRTLIPFELQVGACFGEFYDFEFKRDNFEELTSIGYAANYAAKLQCLAENKCICVSQDVFDNISEQHRDIFSKLEDNSIRKYNQECYYEGSLNDLNANYSFHKDLIHASEVANQVNLCDIEFRDASKQLSYTNLSKKECKRMNGIPLFADVRGFTSQFDSEDANLDEMAIKTQGILTSMYDVVKLCKGTHVQFQGDREVAVFNDYSSYCCINDAITAGLRLIDKVKSYKVCIGVGQSYGRLFATKIGTRGEKDNILLGRTVTEADKNEDKFAEENQLVISNDIYGILQKSNPDLASIFKRKGSLYYTTLGHQAFIQEVSRKRLNLANKSNDYNGAWGKCFSE